MKRAIQKATKVSKRVHLNQVRFIGAQQVEDMTETSRWTLWRWEREGRFPRRMKVGSGGGRSLWLESEVEKWMSDRLRERTATVS